MGLISFWDFWDQQTLCFLLSVLLAKKWIINIYSETIWFWLYFILKRSYFTEPIGSSAPKVLDQNLIRKSAVATSNAGLLCEGQGFPSPVFRCSLDFSFWKTGKRVLKRL